LKNENSARKSGKWLVYSECGLKKKKSGLKTILIAEVRIHVHLKSPQNRGFQYEVHLPTWGFAAFSSLPAAK
jgi:hypothetical protein